MEFKAAMVKVISPEDCLQRKQRQFHGSIYDAVEGNAASLPAVCNYIQLLGLMRAELGVLMQCNWQMLYLLNWRIA